jgi:hypothetical protein
MKLHDYPEPDSLSIEFTDAPGTKAREIVERLVAGFDAAGLTWSLINPMAFRD